MTLLELVVTGFRRGFFVGGDKDGQGDVDGADRFNDLFSSWGEIDLPRAFETNGLDADGDENTCLLVGEHSLPILLQA